MGYTIDYNSDKNFISIKVKGKLSFKLVEKYSIEALKLAHLNSCHKFLINHKETEPEDSGIYKLHTDGAALEKFGFGTTDKIAIVISHIKDNRLHSEGMEHNAKWCLYKYFHTVEEALNWINNGT
jgi:hypothetical protein